MSNTSLRTVIGIRVVDNSDRVKDWQRIAFGFFGGAFFDQGLWVVGETEPPLQYLFFVLHPLLTVLSLTAAQYGLWWKDYSGNSSVNSNKSVDEGETQ